MCRWSAPVRDTPSPRNCSTRVAERGCRLGRCRSCPPGSIDQLGVGDASGQDAAVRRGNHTVAAPADDQGGGSDGAEERDARPAREREQCQNRPNGSGRARDSAADGVPTRCRSRPVAWGRARRHTTWTRGPTDGPVRGVAGELLSDGTPMGEPEHVGIAPHRLRRAPPRRGWRASKSTGAGRRADCHPRRARRS